MRKRIISMALVITLGLSSFAYGADVVITITIPDAQVARAVKILTIYPIPKVDEEDPASADKYTTKQWLKIIITRYLKSLVMTAERNEAEQAARDGISNVEVAQ